jgi:hypothetical protein
MLHTQFEIYSIQSPEEISMYKKLLELLDKPFSHRHGTPKGVGSVDFYVVPKEKVEEVRKLLGVELNQSKLAYCENVSTGYKSDICVEIYVPDCPDLWPTAQLYGIPYDQTDDPYLYLSTEVVLS